MSEVDHDRISANSFSNEPPDMEHYSWMFMEDFYQNIVPLYGEKEELVNCILSPENKKFERALTEMLPSLHDRRGRDFNTAILESIHYLASHLVTYGHIALELVEHHNGNSQSHRLVAVYGDNVEIQKEFVIQTVHKATAQQWNIKHPIKIPIEKCFIIEFPQNLGGEKGYLDFISHLKQMGKESPMMNFLDHPLKENRSYDATLHHKLFELELWTKTNKYRWHHRASDQNLFSSYYFIYRRLNFRKTQLILRDYVIEELKGIILSLGKKVKVDATLNISGLTTIQEVEEQLALWQTGKLDVNTFNQVL